MSEQLRTVLSYKRQPVVSPQLLLHESTSLLIPTSKSCIPPPSMSYSFLPHTPPPKRRRSHAENLNVHIPLFRLQMQFPHKIPVAVPNLRHNTNKNFRENPRIKKKRAEKDEIKLTKGKKSHK